MSEEKKFKSGPFKGKPLYATAGIVAVTIVILAVIANLIGLI